MANIANDIPSNLKPFFKIFERVAHRHQYSEVFFDFILMTLNWFANAELKDQWLSAAKKYSKEELQLFNEMFHELLRVFSDEINTKGQRWFDPFGNLYQTISSNYKASAMGQFFTPESVCDMIAMSMINGQKDEEGNYKVHHATVGEPACGSGRLILAAHAHNPMNFYWACDKDPICAKMTAINMCLHNAAGVVFVGDSLAMEFHIAYYIDRVEMGGHVLPRCRVMTVEEANKEWSALSYYCSIVTKNMNIGSSVKEEIEHDPESFVEKLESFNTISEIKTEKQEIIPTVIIEKPKKKKDKYPTQLNLFDL